MKSEIDSKELYKLMVEASPNALLLIDKSGKILHINKSAEDLFQYLQHEILGQTIDILVPGKYANKHPANRTEYFKKPETRSMGIGRDLFGLRKDKTEFPAEIGLNPILIAKKKYVLATVIDISERKKHETEINLRNKQLAELSFKLTQLNNQLEIKNKNISESIEYARNIQLSILPEKTELKKYFQDLVLYYSPKDIIGGDFYWFKQNGNIKSIAVVDCTGHSVPGAMLSIVVFSLLNEVRDENPDADTGDQLSLLHSKLYSFLQQEKGEDYSQDGCDISLCKIDCENRTIQYSGARQNLYLFKENEIDVIKATSKSIGGCSVFGLPEPKRSFKTENIQLKATTLIAMTTDGIIDQLDKNDKVFGYKNFKNILLANKENSGSQIDENLAKKIDLWKKDTEQLDDMLAIMFKL